MPVVWFTSGVVNLKRGELPSISGLVSFVAAARHESFTGAARELGLSQGAVSRHICELEHRLGVRLFERVRQRVVLTESGKLYLSHVKKPLEELAAARDKVVALADDAILTLAVSPTFAARWLMPRLPDFQGKNPDIFIHMTTPQSPEEFAATPFEAAVFYDLPHWPGVTAHHLMDMDMIAVANPILRASQTVRTGADMAEMPLLHHSSNRWAAWMANAGIDASLDGHTYQNFGMVVQAAVAGLGVALIPRYMAEKELAVGQLEIIGGHLPTTQITYYLLVPDTHVSMKVVQAFGQWVTMEARKYTAATKALLRKKEAAQPLKPAADAKPRSPQIELRRDPMPTVLPRRVVLR